MTSPTTEGNEKQSRPTYAKGSMSMRSMRTPFTLKKTAQSVRNLFSRKERFSESEGSTVIGSLPSDAILKEANTLFDDKLQALMTSVSELANKDRALTNSERQNLISNVQSLSQLRKGMIPRSSDVDQVKQEEPTTPNTSDDNSSLGKTGRRSIGRNSSDGSDPVGVEIDVTPPLWSQKSSETMSDDSTPLLVKVRSPRKNRRSRFSKAASERRFGESNPNTDESLPRPQFPKQMSVNNFSAPTEIFVDLSKHTRTSKTSDVQELWKAGSLRSLPKDTQPPPGPEGGLLKSKTASDDESYGLSLLGLVSPEGKKKPTGPRYARSSSVSNINDSGKLRIPSTIVLSPLVKNTPRMSTNNLSEYKIKSPEKDSPVIFPDNKTEVQPGTDARPFRRAASARCINSAPFCEASPTNHAAKKSIEMSGSNLASMSIQDLFAAADCRENESTASTISTKERRAKQPSRTHSDDMSMDSTICSTAFIEPGPGRVRANVNSTIRAPHSPSKHFVKQLSARVRASQSPRAKPPRAPRKPNLVEESRRGRSTSPVKRSQVAPTSSKSTKSDVSPQRPMRNLPFASSNSPEKAPCDLSPQRPARRTSLNLSPSAVVPPRDSSPQRPCRRMSFE